MTRSQNASGKIRFLSFFSDLLISRAVIPKNYIVIHLVCSLMILFEFIKAYKPSLNVGHKGDYIDNWCLCDRCVWPIDIGTSTARVIQRQAGDTRAQ